MSSTYQAICLNHDPPFEVGYWQKISDAEYAITYRTDPLETHSNCDLIIGEYSYPIVRVGCPRFVKATRLTQCQSSWEHCRASPIHSVIEWWQVIQGAALLPKAPTGCTC